MGFHLYRTAMLEFFLEPDLMPFHISVLVLILLSMAETFGYYIGLRPSTFLKLILPDWLTHSPPDSGQICQSTDFCFLTHQFQFCWLLFTTKPLCHTKSIFDLVLRHFTCIIDCHFLYCFYDPLPRSGY